MSQTESNARLEFAYETVIDDIAAGEVTPAKEQALDVLRARYTALRVPHADLPAALDCLAVLLRNPQCKCTPAEFSRRHGLEPKLCPRCAALAAFQKAVR